ncbi:MAG: Mov34/MPN/PAD-1 family protein, partial [Candidatus Micrarchaeota archaeon]
MKKENENEKVRIKRVAFELILGVSRNLYPNEFIGLLRKNKRGIISEVLVLPQSTYGKGFSSINLYMIPMHGNYHGSVHSHPSRSAFPSRGDLHFFDRLGSVHIIVAYPFRE